MGPSPLGFEMGRARSRPAPPAPETASTHQPGTTEDEPAQEQQDLEPRGLRAQAARIRDLASGHRRPLGSPEGTAQAMPSPRSKSRDSSDERRFVDFLAVSIRSATKWLDWALGDRLGKDFVATSEECLLIASPAAGVILDKIPETGPLADLEEKAGTVGAGVAAATYLGRVMFGKPGGRAESEELHEDVVRRMTRGKKRVAEEVEHATRSDDGAGEVDRPRARSLIYGLSDDDFGTESVGPA